MPGNMSCTDDWSTDTLIVPNMRKSAKKEVRKRAGEIMKKIGLDDSDRVLDSYPFELSGGMNQRVGICTAMILLSELAFADGLPVLDVTVQKQVVKNPLLRANSKTLR